MRIVVHLCVVACGTLLLSGCGRSSKPPVSENKPVEQVRAEPGLVRTEPAAIVHLRLVNVLEEKFFNDAHIKGGVGVESLNVPFVSAEQFKERVKDWDRSVTVVTYCSNYWCSASDEAARLFVDLGFKDVRVYKGGTAEWFQLSKQSPNEFFIDGPTQESYLSMKVAPPAQKRGTGQPEIVAAQELQNLIKKATMLCKEKLVK